jgi:hypothetical protein
MSLGLGDVCQWPIVLKKSKMPPQQNSRKSEPMADFGLRCPLRVFWEGHWMDSLKRGGSPHVPKRQAHQRLLENRS